MKIINKLEIANNMVKDYIKENYEEDSYPYIDFVIENRFLIEIHRDKNADINKYKAKELAEYAIEKIEKGVSMKKLFGF